MRNPIYVFGCLVVAACFVVCNSSGRPEAGQTPTKEALLEKDAVAKVLAGHRFTPPLPLPGPTGLTWYVSARSFTPNSVDQVMVGVRRGAHFTVEVAGFRRDREESPWVALGKGSEPAIAKMEQSLREQLNKELALEEKPK